MVLIEESENCCFGTGKGAGLLRGGCGQMLLFVGAFLWNCFFVPYKTPLSADMGMCGGILRESQEGVYKPLSPLRGNSSPSILFNGHDLEIFLILSLLKITSAFPSRYRHVQ